MPRPYPPEFRASAIDLVGSGKQIKQTAYDLDISAGCLRNWITHPKNPPGDRPIGLVLGTDRVAEPPALEDSG